MLSYVGKINSEKVKQMANKNSKSNDKKSIIYAGVVAAIIIALIAIVLIFSEKDGKTTTATQGSAQSTPVATQKSTYNPAPLDEALTYYADIDIKDHGTITVKLDQASAPITCANFVELANSGFYDGLTLHRIIEGFMMQGGDPLGTGMGGSDNNIVGEFTSNGHYNPISHTRGTISMARSMANDSASSQFFIVHQDSTFLDGEYAGFGTVTEGIEIVDKICTEAKPSDNNGSIPADEQPVINSITIRTE